MKSFTDFLYSYEGLDEGVVKVPPKLYGKMKDLLWTSVLSRNYDRYMDSETIDKKFFKFISKLMLKYNVTKNVESPYFEKVFNYNIKSMSSNYPRIKSPQITTIIITDDVKLKNGTSFMKNLGGQYKGKGKTNQSILINCSFYLLDKYPNTVKDLSVAGFKSSMKKIEQVIEHELMHSVQFNLLKGVDKTQFSKATIDKYPKATDRELYCLSPVEFDPTIVSAIADYADVLLLKKAYSDTKIPEIESFHDITNPSNVSRNGIGFESKMFFSTLKKYDLPRWKIAVKKLRELLITRSGVKI